MPKDNPFSAALRSMLADGQLSPPGAHDAEVIARTSLYMHSDRRDNIIFRATYLAFEILKEEMLGMLKVIAEQTRPLRDQDDHRFSVLLDALREKNFNRALEIIEDLKVHPEKE